MIKITIDADNAFDARRDLLTLAGMMGDTATVSISETVAEAPAAKPARAKPAGKAATPAAATPAASQPADQVDAELLEEVPPAPAAAAQVVDAGTGQPVVPAAQQTVEATATKQMTVDDVRKEAAKLAQKDTGKLAELIKKHGGTNISSIPPINLGMFAADVIDAIG